MGPLLARTGRVRLAPPGGDFPTRRTIATHVQALVALGARVVSESGYELDAPDGLRGASFYLDEASVTGTETAVLAAAAAEGVTEIRHAATEPHVVELCEFLQAMGVRSKAPARDDPDEGRTHRKGATSLHGDIAGSWRWWRPSPAAPSTCVARAVTGADHLVLQRMKRTSSSSRWLQGARIPRRAINRLTTGLGPASERHGQSGHRYTQAAATPIHD
jgi:UDP-N-acetylglucosamine 1-carboxyvinyltransferase